MIRLRELNQYRRRDLERRHPGEVDQDFAGIFLVPHGSVMLHCIASNDGGWDHVSISTNLPRTPNWAEMDFIKRLFFKPTETAMQLHVPVSQHINCHPYTLHLWRPHDGEIPLPPAEYV